MRVIRITETHIFFPVREQRDGAVAFATLILNDELMVHGIKVYEDRTGVQVLLPRCVSMDLQECFAIVPMNFDLQDEIYHAVTTEYRRQKNERK